MRDGLAIGMDAKEDAEKQDPQQVDLYLANRADVAYDPVQTEKLGIGGLTRRLLLWGVETRGMFNQIFSDTLSCLRER